VDRAKKAVSRAYADNTMRGRNIGAKLPSKKTECRRMQKIGLKWHERKLNFYHCGRKYSPVPYRQEIPVTKVLLAENHKRLRKSLRSFLGHHPDIEVIGEAKNGREAIERCKELDIDLILMDLNMPDIDGLEATRRITAEFPHIHVIVLTSHFDNSYLAAALDAGAKAFVEKINAVDELLDTIRSVVGGA